MTDLTIDLPDNVLPLKSVKQLDERVRILQDHVDDCVARKNRLNPPLHSLFRVCASVLYRLDGEIHKEVGANWETCNMSQAICAERCALTALRVKVEDLSRIEMIGIIICSDAPTFITPGPLCREYMSEYPSIKLDTPILLVDGNKDTEVHTLDKLWPHPCRYRGGVTTAVPDDSLEKVTPEYKQFFDVVNTAHSAAINGIEMMTKREKLWYKICYAAAVRFEDGSIRSCVADQALEYGCSLDAVQQVYVLMKEMQASGVMATHLVMCDQYGRLHAPFATARALLSELYESHVSILLHNEHNKLEETSSYELYNSDTLDLSSALSTSDPASPLRCTPLNGTVLTTSDGR